MKNFVFGFLAALILFGVLFGAYYLGTRTNTLPTQTPTPTFEAVNNQPSNVNLEVISTPVAVDNPQAFTISEVKSKILTVLATKKYDELEVFMKDNVFVRKEQSSCCGVLSREEAIEEIKYVSSATLPWKFDSNNSIVLGLKAFQPKYYGGNSYVGVSANDYSISFVFNSENKIESVSMAANASTLIKNQPTTTPSP